MTRDEEANQPAAEERSEIICLWDECQIHINTNIHTLCSLLPFNDPVIARSLSGLTDDKQIRLDDQEREQIHEF